MARPLLGAEREHCAVLPGEADRPGVVVRELVQAQRRVDRAGIKTRSARLATSTATAAKNASYAVGERLRRLASSRRKRGVATYVGTARYSSPEGNAVNSSMADLNSARSR